MGRLLCIVLVAVAGWVGLSAQDREPRIVMISVDGLIPSSYTSAEAEQTAPNLFRLAKSGAWADGVVGVLPTVTYPSHTTLITGVDPARHGIIDNRIVDPENRSSGAWNWYARDIKVTTLPMAARARGLRAAAISWPVTIGMDLDFLVPEYFRFSHPETLSLIRALTVPRGLLEAAEANRRRRFDWPMTDRDRTDLAAFILKTFDPHLILIHLIDLDSVIHTHGPASIQARETLTQVDTYVGEILDVVRNGPAPDNTHVAVVSDHGFLPLVTQLQPNAVFKREGLLTINDRGNIASWQAYFHSSGGSGFVYVKDAAKRPAVLQILNTMKSDPANGIREIWTSDELAARGAHPDAAFGLDVVDGFYTSGDHDEVIKPSPTKGGHGFAPERPALHASFILTGPTVEKRGSLGIIRMTSIAPTLAAILGVHLDSAAPPPLPLVPR
jgi:predicted AlkP superfamily pyrophosphatase or phosphodiesterase